MNELSDSNDDPIDLLKQFFQVDKVKDPEEDLQAAQIDARRLLFAAEQIFLAQKHEENKLCSKLAAVRLLIGKNCLDTNEFDEAEKYLSSGLAISPESQEYDHETWGIRVESEILLGVAQCKRCKVESSLSHLEKAKNSFCTAESAIASDPPLTPEGLLIETETEFVPANRTEYFQQLYTHGLYYLAQVHLQLGHKDEASFYCQKTLARQIDNEKTLDSHDWAINCASLAQVFLDESNYQAAVHYLACALAMEERVRESKPEEYSEFHASMHRCISNLGLCILEHYVESFNEEENGGNAETGEKMTDKSGNSCDFLRQAGLAKMNIDVQKIESALQSHPPKNYEQARDVFLLTQRSLLEARDTFYTIDTHCNDYIEITQNYSKLFKLMASIEPDLSRRVAMHRRRADMLTALIDRLNPQFYLYRYRQLTYELAETYNKMVDIELSVIDQKQHSRSTSTSKHEDKVNSWADAAIAAYNKYLNSLKQPFGEFSKPLPDPLPDADLRPVICAYLTMGRLYSKKISTEVPERLANLLKSEKYYKEIKAYCDRHESAVSKVQAELNASVEMLNLMPVKLEAVRQGSL